MLLLAVGGACVGEAEEQDASERTLSRDDEKTSSAPAGGDQPDGNGEPGESGSGGAAILELGAKTTGIATWYDATGSGSCGFPESPSDLDVVAFNGVLFAGSAACGSCVRVTGPSGETTVRVVDWCPECASDHLDLSLQAFEKITGDREIGRVAITFQTVSCAVAGPIQYHFKEGSSEWWTAIQIRNHRLPIVKVEYRRDGAFVEMTRQSYNYFLEENGVGPQPNGLVVRVTAQGGKALEDVLPRVANDETFAGTAQF